MKLCIKKHLFSNNILQNIEFLAKNASCNFEFQKIDRAMAVKVSVSIVCYASEYRNSDYKMGAF